MSDVESADPSSVSEPFQNFSGPPREAWLSKADVLKLRGKILPLQVIDDRVRLNAQAHGRPLILRSRNVYEHDDFPVWECTEQRLQRFDDKRPQHMESVNLDLMTFLAIIVTDKKIVALAEIICRTKLPQRF